MVPGGATPLGALGYVSAGLELGLQIEAGLLPRPERVLIGVGSTCTSAGLLVGFAHAARLGVGFRSRAGKPAPPELCSVRVTPWPVTSKTRIVGLAARTAALLAKLCGEPALALSRAELGSRFSVTGAFLGRGYGHATDAGQAALELWRAHAGHALDTTYSAKAAAAFLAVTRAKPGPTLLWATKSSVPLPAVDEARLASAPPRVQRWLARAARELEASGLAG